MLRGNALGWTSTTVLGCLALCAVALAAFVAVERRDRAADARPGLFRNRTFTGATAIIALLAGGPFGAFVYVTLFLLEVQDRDPVEAGLVLAPLALVSFVVSAAAGRASERVPLRGALDRRDADHGGRDARAARGRQRGRDVADAASRAWR